jgi:hypothetical protein
MTEPTTVMVGEWHGNGLDIENLGRCALDMSIEIGEEAVSANSMVGPAPAPG